MSFASFFPSLLTRRSFALSALAAPLSFFTTRTAAKAPDVGPMPSTTCHFIRPAEYTIAFPTERQARHLERESEARYGRDGGVILRAGSVLVWIEPVRENLPAL